MLNRVQHDGVWLRGRAICSSPLRGRPAEPLASFGGGGVLHPEWTLGLSALLPHFVEAKCLARIWSKTTDPTPSPSPEGEGGKNVPRLREQRTPLQLRLDSELPSLRNLSPQGERGKRAV